MAMSIANTARRGTCAWVINGVNNATNNGHDENSTAVNDELMRYSAQKSNP